MPEIEIIESVREKLDWLAGKILERFTGLKEFTLKKENVRSRDIKRIAGVRVARRFRSSGIPCDRY